MQNIFYYSKYPYFLGIYCSPCSPSVKQRTLQGIIAQIYYWIQLSDQEAFVVLLATAL